MKNVRRVLGMLCLTAWVMAVQAQGGGPGFRLVGSISRMVPVTGMKMTNLIFPVAVAEGVKVSRDILAQKVKGVENVVELKAVRRGFVPTNLSVYGKDGRLYSFELRYVEDTTVLNYRVVPDDLALPNSAGTAHGRHPIMLSGLPVDEATLDQDAARLAGQRRFIHKSTKSEGMRLQLRGVFLRDSLLWLCLRLSNTTRISFTPAYCRVFVEDRKQVRRTASQQVLLEPVYGVRLLPVAGNSFRPLVMGMEPFTLARGKKLVIEVGDKSGGRLLMLDVKGRMLLRARVVR